MYWIYPWHQLKHRIASVGQSLCWKIKKLRQRKLVSAFKDLTERPRGRCPFSGGLNCHGQNSDGESRESDDWAALSEKYGREWHQGRLPKGPFGVELQRTVKLMFSNCVRTSETGSFLLGLNLNIPEAKNTCKPAVSLEPAVFLHADT